MRQWPSLIGQRFGRLVVIGQEESTEKGRRRWVCRCDCGNTCTVSSSNLTGGRTTSCGCKKYNDLTGQKIGRLTVLERSDQYATRGQRTVQLWKCRCDCGTITYKATDVLTNDAISMCQDCAARYGIQKAREKAGFTGGTQLTKIINPTTTSGNCSGVRGVYLDSKTGRYRARIKLQGKLHNLGSYHTLEEAIEARRAGEERIFGSFLERYPKEDVCE